MPITAEIDFVGAHYTMVKNGFCARGITRKEAAFLRPAIKRGIARSENLLAAPLKTEIIVCIKPDGILRGRGVGGIASGPDSLAIFLDPAYFSEPGFLEEVSSVVAHELYHLARMPHFPHRSISESLSDRLINEGLAVAFQRETGHDISRTVQGYDPKAMENLRARIQPYFWSTLDFGDAHEMDVYAPGYAIVESYLQAEGKRASQITGILPAEILKAWKTGGFEVFGSREELPVFPEVSFKQDQGLRAKL